MYDLGVAVEGLGLRVEDGGLGFQIEGRRCSCFEV